MNWQNGIIYCTTQIKHGRGFMKKLNRYTKQILLAGFAAFAALHGCSSEPSVAPPSTDTTPPVLTLTEGDDTLLIGVPWDEPGYTAIDEKDGNISSNVVISGEPNELRPGRYTITYSITDNAGNTATQSRIIDVILHPSTVAFYPFSGDADDYSGNNLHGTVIDGATLAEDRFGADSSAYHFDGTGYIEVDYNSLLRSGAADSFS
ncbi:MAG: DUF5011 domain-containing protein [Chitinivibrionales bacterium]|nr:DUF5011 domain-containing protein [Chitinivibrionales bacterium]